MTRMLAFAAVALFGTAGFAQAQDVPGSYHLSVGRAAPCTLTLTADGGATLAPECALPKPATHWRKSGGLVKLSDDGNTTVALLKPTQDGFAGTTIPDGVALIATR